MPKDVFYFSHDYSARNDPKLQRVLMKMGHEGKGLYWDIIEMLYEQDGRLSLSEIDSYAFSLRCNPDLISRLTSDFDLFESDNEFFWSNSVLLRLEKRNSKTSSARQSALKKWGITDDGVDNGLKRSERLSLARLKGTHSKDDWNEMVLFFNGICVKCGSNEKIVKDHIIPIYQGGSDGLYNLQPLCQKCNCSKGSENIDHRKKYCLRNNLKMPANYIETPAIKESKEEENKESIIVGLTPPTTPSVGVGITDRCQRFVAYFNKKRGTKFKATAKVLKNFKIAIKDYSSEDLKKSIEGAMADNHHIESNFKWLTPEFVLKVDIIERYTNLIGIKEPQQQAKVKI